ncbi:MAG: deoxyuridine 5'-triphosphate nucleotidohydrolase [Deltaproteobacteria bacterium CG2_30_63_29]|nr:MAG: deoxyuridine 5'-triphosphate nucleotidohydrolase [Deltaproteobacteria bacterium CG2_30_63_29]PIW02463.1 MAG: dUTP diphosphatase [Deltaproteobacteria bacterium CG17_big_fil_post_rev_8_21_14_2_50_63_7]PJB35329.1 MAG: dUTP diphosphatase [Deltaproteobacteria bacterium CG_4_9_14_3_um_filter_63_12]
MKPTLEIPVKRLHEQAKLPHRGSPQAAGWDLHAAQPARLKPGARELVGTGLAVALPLGYEMQIRPRSGLAIKHGISVLNSPGTIDADYRGEIKIILINHGSEDFVVEVGDRIAQAIVAKHEVARYEWVEELTDSERGAGGFGHTGIRGE